MKLSDLFLDGVIVSVHVSEWRARLGIKPGDIKVDWSAEVERAMYLGAHRLADAAAFEAIHAAVSAAQRAVERRSIAFPLIPASRYMPAGRLEDCAAELAEHKRAFGVAVEAFCEVERFAEMRARQMVVIGDALSSVLKPGLVEGGSEAFERAMGRIRMGYPAPEDCRPQFSLTWQVFSLQSSTSAVVGVLSGEAEQVRGLLGSMMLELRSEITDKLADVLAIVARGGKLNKRTIESALGVVERVASLNVWGDAVLAEQCDRLTGLLGSVASMGALGEARAVEGLRDVAAALSADVAAAVAVAESSLTGLGRRKLVA